MLHSPLKMADLKGYQKQKMTMMPLLTTCAPLWRPKRPCRRETVAKMMAGSTMAASLPWRWRFGYCCDGRRMPLPPPRPQ